VYEDIPMPVRMIQTTRLPKMVPKLGEVLAPGPERSASVRNTSLEGVPSRLRMISPLFSTTDLVALLAGLSGVG